jgi:hypothetical protein
MLARQIHRNTLQLRPRQPRVCDWWGEGSLGRSFFYGVGGGQFLISTPSIRPLSLQNFREGWKRVFGKKTIISITLLSYLILGLRSDRERIRCRG